MRNRYLAIVIGVLVVIMLAVGAYLFTRRDDGGMNTASTTNNTATNNTTTAKNTVVMQNSAFSPATITVNKGDTVTWVNNDPMTHRVAADDGSFDLGDQANGASVSHTFTQAGTYAYHCTIHPFMKGTVIVQ